ncbi:Hypothetical protein D9617_2g057620 [Elsinoe fawcettii]|nr:Hypothetical protein D9617_2g057620 [Elsinoe fawcettii]
MGFGNRFDVDKNDLDVVKAGVEVVVSHPEVDGDKTAGLELFNGAATYATVDGIIADLER